MRAAVSMVLLALLALPTGTPAQTAAGKPVVIATGDSYTRRTPCASKSYDECDAARLIVHEVSYSTYLNSATKYEAVLSDNSARGGETCTLQAPFGSGPWTGEYRGLLNQVDERVNHRDGDVVSLLIGINDVNAFNVAPSALQACLQQLYNSMTLSRKKVVAMTYPPVSADTKVWGDGNGPVASANVSSVNDAIRAAVRMHNAAYPARPVLLAETSLAWSSSQVGAFTSDGAHPGLHGAIELARTWKRLVCGTGYVACSR